MLRPVIRPAAVVYLGERNIDIAKPWIIGYDFQGFSASDLDSVACSSLH